jgi:hypothetical protein
VGSLDNSWRGLAAKGTPDSLPWRPLQPESGVSGDPLLRLDAPTLSREQGVLDDAVLTVDSPKVIHSSNGQVELGLAQDVERVSE